jgi:hypothetical protein
MPKIKVAADPSASRAGQPMFAVRVPLAMTATADDDVTFWLTVDEAREFRNDLVEEIERVTKVRWFR